MKRAACAFDVGLSRNDLARILDLEHGQRVVERGRHLRQIGHDAGRAVPHAHDLAMISGPIPAGSPIETTSGGVAPPGGPAKLVKSAILDHRVASQVAQLLLGAQVDARFLELALHLVGRRQLRRLGVVATAQDEAAHTLFR